MPAQLIEIFATGYSKDGAPVALGTVEVYEAGTSTPAAVWYDRAKTNPTAGGVTSFTLDAQGRKIVYGDDVYKFVVKDAAGVTLATIDDAEYAAIPATVAAASTTVQGKIELATQTEVNTGTDAVRAVTPETLAGSTNTKAGVLNVKVINIGDWNMDSTASVTVAHGLTLAKIRPPITAIIRKDTDDAYYDMNFVSDAGTSFNGVSLSATNVTLTRRVGGFFDSTDYDSTSFNRGWITLFYVD